MRGHCGQVSWRILETEGGKRMEWSRSARAVSGVNEGLMSSLPSRSVPEAVVASLYCSLGYRAVIRPGHLHKGNVMFTAIPTHTQHNESHSLPTLATALCQERRQTLAGLVCVRVHTHTHTCQLKNHSMNSTRSEQGQCFVHYLRQHSRTAHNASGKVSKEALIL